MKSSLYLLVAAATLAAASSASAASITKAGSGTDLSLGASWTGGIAPGSGDIATWSTGSLGGTETLGANTTWDGISYNNFATATIVTGANQTLTLGGSGIDMSAATSNLFLQSGANGSANILNLTLSSNQAWNVASGFILKYAGETSATTFTNPTATANLGGKEVTIGGAGIVEVNQANISNGMFTVAATSFGANNGNLTFAAAGNVRVAVASNVTVNVASGSAVRLHIGGGGGGSTFAQTTNLNGGTLAFSSSSASTVDYTGTINFGASTTSTVSAGLGTATAANTNISTLAGSGNVNFVRANGTTSVITITGTHNNFTGTVNITSGILAVAANDALGTGSLGISNGQTLSAKTGTTVSLANSAVNLGSGSATYNFGDATNNGNITFTTAQFGVGGSAKTLNVADNVTVTYQAAAGLSGTGSLVKTGNGALSINATNYTGATTVTAGTLEFGSSALGNTSGISMNGGTLRWKSGNTNDVSAKLGMVAAKAAKLDTNGNNVTLSTAFGGNTTGSLIKAGAGSLSLNAANTYTGGTTVNAGTLIAGHMSALGSGNVSLAGGTLQVGNQVSIGSGANITTTAATASVLKFAANLGADTGSGALANITLSGGKYDFSAGTVTLDLSDAFNVAGTYHLIAGGTGNVDASSYSFLNFNSTNWAASFSNGDLVVSAVPEPSTYGLIGAGALAAVAAVRRRRRNAGAVA